MKKKGFAITFSILGSLSFSFLASGCDLFDLIGQKSSSSSSSSSSQSSKDSSLPTDSSLSSSTGKTSSSFSDSSQNSDSSPEEKKFSPISFHFIEENVQKTGDAIYIKAGDNDILMDSGATKGVASTIKSYLDNYVTDGKLEYVFSTHAHQDHISGFVGKSDGTKEGGRDGLLYAYKIDNFIDFSYYMTSKVTIDNASSHVMSEAEEKASTILYKDYLKARSYAISKGAKHYLAKDLTTLGNNWKVTLGEGVSMTLLYQFYYDHDRSETKALDDAYAVSGFSDQNDCSLSLLFEQGDKKMLFTGDSEKYAESSLVRSNPELGPVTLFKAGHHGSPTASGSELLSVIKPQAVVACCVAGNTEYGQKTKETTFPGQDVINRVSSYTDRFYALTEGSFTDKNFHRPLNGNVVFSYDENGSETVTFSASDKKLKDTLWFSENRTLPESWKREETLPLFLLPKTDEELKNEE